MYLTREVIKAMEDAYGTPRKADFHIPIDENEFKRIKRSQKDGRKHDITLYILKENKIKRLSSS